MKRKEWGTVTCIYCGEIYTRKGLIALKNEGEEYHLGTEGFVCPECLHEIDKGEPQEQLKELMFQIGGSYGT